MRMRVGIMAYIVNMLAKRKHAAVAIDKMKGRFQDGHAVDFQVREDVSALFDAR